MRLLNGLVVQTYLIIYIKYHWEITKIKNGKDLKTDSRVK